MQTQSVRVERAFYYQGKPTKVGDVVELPSIFAREMIAANKAAAVQPAAKPETRPEQKTVEAGAKGGGHAR